MRFELTEPFGSVVFKTTGLSHSPNYPNEVVKAVTSSAVYHRYQENSYTLYLLYPH